MPLNWEVTESDINNGRLTAVRVQAVSKELRDEIQALITATVAEGERYAKSEAPRGNMAEGHDGSRIVDAIKVGPIVYKPGGAGGGGFYEASLEADASVAPHLQFVMEGTGERHIPPMGRIYPARGNVMAITKEGEGTHFVRWTRGQYPNSRWWQDANFHMQHMLAEGVSRIKV